MFEGKGLGKYTSRPNFSDGAIAQLGERLHGMQEVVGSIPSGSTTPFIGRSLVEVCGNGTFRLLQAKAAM